MGIQFYCGISDSWWNKERPNPFGLACVSPVYGRTTKTRRRSPVYIPPNTEVILDSGAFSDSWSERITPQAALDRQLLHTKLRNYDPKYLVAYDMLIDEKWENGTRHKERWSVQEAESAIETTVKAAKFLASQKNFLRKSLILPAQGVDAEQYLNCAKQIVPLLQEDDVFGLGGWCIIGIKPKTMLPPFYETIKLVIPFLAQEHVKRVHIFGVIYPKALGPLLYLCNQYNIKLSTDSASPITNINFGNFGYGNWRWKEYQTPDVEIRGQHKILHVYLTKQWLAHLEDTPYYKTP